MCLYSKQQEAAIAECDIICYKLFFIIDRLDKPDRTVKKVGDITAVFRDDYIYHFDKDTKKAVEPDFAEHVEYSSPFSDEIEYDINDGFHSYKTKEEAEDMAKMFVHDQTMKDGKRRLVLYRCVIPVGSHYYEGMSSWTKSGYCSDTIMLNELLIDYSWMGN
jgi:hypothetical protein